MHKLVQVMLLSTLALTACVRADVEVVTSPILGGFPATAGDYPTVVAVTNAGLCTGTLISPRVVATAAHCVAPDSEANGWQVYFGSNVEGSDSAYLGVRDVVKSAYHSYWNPSDLANGYDVDLLKLEYPGPADPKPINRNSIWGMEGRSIRLVGFGNNTATSGSKIKRQVTTNVTGVFNRLVEFGTHTENICSGDSGGPTFIGGRIAGITSFGVTFFSGGGDVDDVYNNSWGEFGGDTRASYHKSWIAGFAPGAVAPLPGSLPLLTCGLLMLGLGRAGRRRAA